MKTHALLAQEAIGFAPKTFTDAEWKIEAARIRAANEKRKAKLNQGGQRK
jgi:hypothetical protein